MTERIHIYCDESCHLENDHLRAMVLGAIWCPASHRQALARKIKALKAEHGLPPQFEIKWVKVSPGQLPFYQALRQAFRGGKTSVDGKPMWLFGLRPMTTLSCWASATPSRAPVTTC